MENRIESFGNSFDHIMKKLCAIKVPFEGKSNVPCTNLTYESIQIEVHLHKLGNPLNEYLNEGLLIF